MDLTPFQPVGPYFHVMLRDEPRGAACLVTTSTRGEPIVIEGIVLDGAESPVTDALVEIWQADADGRFHHPEDPASRDADAAFAGYGRVATGADGWFRFETIRPGRPAGPAGQAQAPHVLVSLFAPGILARYWTRIYFENEASNASDPVLHLVPAQRRDTLLAHPAGDGRYRFDIRIQGARETVFFET